MPLYEINHITPLASSQQDALAEAITVHHTQTFKAPRLFVNVRFTDVSKQALYVAGRRRTTNHIIANVRHGPSRTQEMYDDLCVKITKSWNDIVRARGHGDRKSEDEELRAVFILGSIVAGAEAGFPLPQAGKDKEWMMSYMADFEKKAEEGDEDFKELIQEVKTRKEFGLS